MISCIFQHKINDIFKETNWQFQKDQNDIKKTIGSGFKKFKKMQLDKEITCSR